MNIGNNKTTAFFSLIVFAFTLLSYTHSPWEQLRVNNLRVESLNNPVGIDIKKPRFSWEIHSPDRGIMQTAYQILVASSPEILDNNKGDLWNSGKVLSDKSIRVPYDGQSLKSHLDCYWKVKVWTENGSIEWSKPSHWSMGLLSYNDWRGRWIGFDRSFPWDDVSMFSRLSARYFRKEFNSENNVKSAKVYIIGLGLYELYVNGKKVGEQVLAPVPTDYAKNVKYNAFEIKDMMRKGDNAIGVILGNGRYFTMRQRYKPYKIKNYGFPKLLFQLEVEYENGEKRIIKSDDSWKGTANGPILTNNEYDGEEYDARKEMPGWNKPGFDDSDWLPAEYVLPPHGDIEAQLTGNMKIMDTILPVSIHKTGPDRYVLDLGQNITGWVKMEVEGKSGKEVKLRYAEILNENGDIFTENLRDARATDIYILNGEGKESWQPRFVYHGFRYVEITGYPGVPQTVDFKGMMVYDEMSAAGTFQSSSKILNQIHENARWGIASNYKGMPVDCPQRNERQPWLGDRTVTSYSESYLFDNYLLYRKWLDDIQFSQKDNGELPDVAPAFWNYYSDNMTWPGTYIFVAQLLYKQYGDIRIIEKHYPSMRKWLNYMKDNYMTEEYIVTKDSYGDWCAPPATIEEGRGMSANVKNPSSLIATAYYYHYTHLMSDFADLLGFQDHSREYIELGKKIRKGFNERFFHPEENYYGDNSLTDNILALSMDLATEDEEDSVFQTVENIIFERNNGHLSTGLVGTQWLMRTLTEYNRPDIALLLAEQTSYPSWGYMVENGATTIWELWNGNTAAPDMNSYNHVMMIGDLLVWYYESLAGIKSDPDNPGFKNIIMKPEFGVDLNEVDATYKSLYGTINSHWKKNGKKITWNISIPANTTADLRFPVSGEDRINEQGLPLSQVEGIINADNKQNPTWISVESGDYSFHFSMN